MRRTGVWIFFLLFLSFSSRSQSQPTFSDNRDEFLKETIQLLSDTKRDDCKETAKGLETAWPQFSNSQQGDIIELAQAMKGRKMLVTPYFLKFFNTVLAFSDRGLSPDLWDTWKDFSLTVIGGLRPGNNKRWENFLDFSYALFSQNAFHIGQGRTWKFDADVYDLEMLDGRPVLRFTDGTLIGVTEGDSLRVEQTSGVFDVFENKWNGQKGQADWSRVGFGSEDAFVTFGSYEIDFTQSNYAVDSARLYYDIYKKTIVYGAFSDKLLSRVNPEYATYPRFNSYRKDLLFENVAPYVKMFGGLELVGAKMNLYGSSEEPAVIKIYRFDKLLGLIAKSRHFDIRKDQEINASQAEIKLMLGKDSVMHGGLTMRYNIDKRELFLFRGKNGINKSAFNDYYHGFELSPEMIFWDMNEPEIIIRNIAVQGTSTMIMESFNYYRKGRMDKYQGIADYNFVNKLKQIVDRTGEKTFYTEDLAKKIDPKYTAVTIQPMLYKLVEDGLISYDDDKEIVTVQAKLFQYVAAREKKIDYDNLRIESISDSVNAMLDMQSYNLVVFGVKNLVMSDTGFVVVFPRNNELTLKQNRDMDFGGNLFAGRLDLSGEGFSFDYGKFRIDLSTVDSVIINIPTGKRDNEGKPTVGPIHSVIEDVTGNLQIDQPTNRSGTRHKPEYPMLITTQPSYVYYDHPKIQGGAYERDQFYFELEPFEFDSLNNFNWTRVGFTGKLISAGIFPDMNDRITIQQDLSLGFKTRKADLALYGKKGTFSNEISLDNSGLRGKGTVRFMTSVTQSANIIFLPDSMLAAADSFRMDAAVMNGVEFPTVRGLGNNVRWLPREDSMIVKMDSVPFRMFDLKTSLRGTLVLQSDGLRGSGFVDWAEAQLSSNDIGFGRNKLSADSCDFLIKSLDPKKFALQTQDVNATVDFDKRIGVFKSNTDEISTTFPYNQYSTSINEFKWEMDKQRMTFTAPPGTSADFTSIHKEQDSLTFQGGNATYDMANYILRVNKVPHLDVVDSRIIPDSNKVVIEADARMRTLKRARLIMDSINEYHVFDSVTANIFGKNSLQASGRYTYLNKSGKAQRIFCDDIGAYRDSADQQLHVYAKGVIDTLQKFVLLPKIFYKGKVNITSAREPVNFRGFARLDITNPKVKAEWFSINNFFTRDSGYIYFNNPQNEARKDMAAGLVFDADSSDLYTSFFNAKKSSRDKNLFVANGLVYYDAETKEFVAGDPGKIVNEAPRGNVLRYNDATGKVTAEGSMNLGFNYGLVTAASAGTVTYNVNKEDPVFTLALGLQFELDEELLNFMAQSVFKGNGGGDGADYTSEHFTHAVTEFLDEKKEKVFREEMNKTGRFISSEQMPYTIFFSKVELKWDKTTRVFYNTTPFEVAFIGKNHIATVIPGYIEMGFKRSGDFFNLYLPAGEEDDDFWFFLNYAANNMQIVAGEQEFNQKLLEVKPERRRVESKDGRIYQYNPGSANKKNTFVNRIKFMQQEAEQPRKK